jgi:hypothetical protein
MVTARADLREMCYAVAREHKKRGYKMAPFTFAVKVVTGMLRQYVELHGTDSLAPSRKNPLTNVLILAMLRATWDWTSYSLIAFRATVETLAETGMRKGDVSKAHKATAFKKGRLTFAGLKWRVGGNITALGCDGRRPAVLPCPRQAPTPRSKRRGQRQLPSQAPWRARERWWCTRGRPQRRGHNAERRLSRRERCKVRHTQRFEQLRIEQPFAYYAIQFDRVCVLRIAYCVPRYPL